MIMSSTSWKVQHPMATTVAVGGLVLVVGWSFRSIWKKKRSSSKGPYPPMVADIGLIGTIQNFAGGAMHKFLIDQFQRQGGIFRLPFPSSVGLPMVVVVANTADARAIYRDAANIKPGTMYQALEALTSGPNIASTAGIPGDSWHHRRKGINPAFAPKQVKRMNQIALEKAEAWIQTTLLPIVRTNGGFDVGTEMILLTITVICEAALDYNVSEKESREILQAIKVGVEEFTFKSIFNPFRQFATWLLQDRRHAFHEVEKLKEFAIKIMKLYRANPSPTPDTVIDMIIKNPNYKDDTERIPDIIMILFAGHDTTGYTMAFALRELAMRPDEQQKLRSHLVKDSQDSKSSSSVNPYLKGALNETMRLNPPAPLTAIKQLGSDMVSQGGYVLPKGSIVFFAYGALARDPSIYPNPDQFLPSRWLQENVTDKAKLAFFPFSLGRRNCVGQPFAVAELQSVLPLLVQKFEFAISQDGSIVSQGTLRLNDCYLKAKPVKGGSVPLE